MLQPITLNHKQTTALEGLAYWIADVHYIAEKYGADDPEHEKAHKTVLMWFEECDKLEIPFWVQNTVIMFSESWRRYKEQYLNSYLAEKGIYTL